jgi:hypothetical protein
MKKSRYSEEQIIGILKEHEAGMKTAELCRKHNISVTCPQNPFIRAYDSLLL